MRARLIAIIGVCTMACATAEDVEGTSIGNTNDSGLGTGGDGSTGVGGAAAGTSGGSGGGFPGGSGGFPSGGSAGVATGGVGGTATGGTGGTATGGGGSGGGGCTSDKKLCGGLCVAPNPGIGCNLTDCTACPQPPSNSTWTCTGTTCDFVCAAGYVKQGQTCISTGSGGTSSGGAPGGGGTGGGGVCQACDPSDPASQFICFSFCVFSGGAGLCVPGLNCCLCGS
jgi:hypothetical protein